MNKFIFLFQLLIPFVRWSAKMTDPCNLIAHARASLDSEGPRAQVIACIMGITHI